ncbi:LegK7 family Dot/Icm T4SS effector kinase [Legionella tucsonensis]|uniref:Protein kinase domain containing protein n=1 Tax=Legionella tucsonensis TaxID=40335 RepID=A0A0W0ZV65_9GAMM|nr:LegK7 family Dot/Icm T4SS effector kinase [Legionella tucsonensis]KTD72980.1 protein kinase domain containing protein [Legionella tucsonensis]
MGLTVIPINVKQRRLIRQIHAFNKIPDEDVVQRLFYLQKINYHINSIPIFEGEFKWLAARGLESWQAHLEMHGINPDGSFLFKGIQFAKAVAQVPASLISSRIKDKVEGKDIYQLMQERDALLKSASPFDEIREQFLAINARLSMLAEKDNILKKNLDEHAQILSLAKEKISAIKGESDLSSSDYKTEVLGKKQVNNFNFKFRMRGWKKTLVFRVEDRNDLSFEQDLHSYPVSKYFANDVALFMMQFKSEDHKEIEFKPVVLSQFANQGSLLDIAKKLRGKPQQKIAARTKYYFNQINDFCLKLKEANAYHPDIKLSNFLVHNHKLLVSDRKTFVRSPRPLASMLRSSPRYAPPQYLACLDEECEDYITKAYTTQIDVEQLMSYQMGKALREFLIVTQLGEIPEQSDEEHRTVLAHFEKPSRVIINLSMLVEELTRYEEGKRLTIEQFQRLLPYINQNIDDFYRQLEKELPAKNLGIERELNEIEQLLHNNRLKGINFLEQANIIFTVVSEQNSKEPRFNRMAEQLAVKCYQECSESYFYQISKEIETALLTKDWSSASWWRRVVHTLSFGFFRVERVTTANNIEISLNFNDQEFRTHFIQMEFLPATTLDSLGASEANNFKDYFQAHLDEIRALNDTDSNSEESGEEEPVDISEKQNNPIEAASTLPPKKCAKKSQEELLSTDTIVVKNNDTKKSGKAISSSKTSAHEESPPKQHKTTSQTHTKPKHKKRTSVDLKENYRFFAELAKGTKNDDPKVRKRSIRRVGSTLFRGEKSSHYTKAQDIFKQPTVPQEKVSHR